MMDNHEHSLTDQAATLSNQLDDASRACDVAAARLRAGQLSAAAELRQMLDALERVVGVLATDVMARARSLQLATDVLPGTIDELRRLAAAVEERERHIAYRTAATALLAQGRRLQHTQGHSPALARALEQMHVWSGAVAGDDGEIAAGLATGQLPLAGLLTLIREREQLADEALDGLSQRVAATFGRPLAIAALMGRLVVPAVAPETTEPEVAAPEVDGTRREPAKRKDAWMREYSTAIRNSAAQQAAGELREQAICDHGDAFDRALASQWVQHYRDALARGSTPSVLRWLRERAEQLHSDIRSRLDAEDTLEWYRNR
jgi:hypothetical protein